MNLLHHLGKEQGFRRLANPCIPSEAPNRVIYGVASPGPPHAGTRPAHRSAWCLSFFTCFPFCCPPERETDTEKSPAAGHLSLMRLASGHHCSFRVSAFWMGWPRPLSGRGGHCCWGQWSVEWKPEVSVHFRSIPAGLLIREHLVLTIHGGESHSLWLFPHSDFQL